jgi:hypothetical protein
VLVRLVLLCFSCLGALACQDTIGRTVFDVRIVNGENGNPVEGTDADKLEITIQEGDLPAEEFPFPVTNGSFDAAIEFQLFFSPTRLRVELSGMSSTLLSAPPVFVPNETRAFIRMVVAAPSSCESVAFNLMEARRAHFGMVLSGQFALLAGGTSADAQLEFFDAIQWHSNTNTLDDLNKELDPLGETRAVSIDEAQILVLPAEAAPFVFDTSNADNRKKQVDLHTGAGPRSALVFVPGLGAMVIGGEAEGEAQSGVTIVGTDAELTSLELREPRSGPTATPVGTDVLVVGGNPVGDAEILRHGQSTGEPVTSLMDGVREGAVLVGDGESRALLLGGVDDADMLRQDTVALTGCPDACVAAAGPIWSTARLEVLLPQGSTLLIGGTGSRLVEEVRWPAGMAEIAPLLELNTSRAGAGAVVLESGAFVVAGGNDGVSGLNDFEFCVPATLAPL